MGKAGLFATPTSSAQVTPLRDRFVLSASAPDLSNIAPEMVATLVVAFFEELVRDVSCAMRASLCMQRV